MTMMKLRSRRYSFSRVLLFAAIGCASLCAAAGDGVPDRTVLMGLDRGYGFRPVAGATDLLAELLDLYSEGLSTPLPLLPTASLAYAEALHNGKTEEAALAAARSAWEGGYRRTGDREDTDLQTCFRRTDPLDERFCEVAWRVFGPLLDHREKP